MFYTARKLLRDADENERIKYEYVCMQKSILIKIH